MNTDMGSLVLSQQQLANFNHVWQFV